MSDGWSPLPPTEPGWYLVRAGDHVELGVVARLRPNGGLVARIPSVYGSSWDRFMHTRGCRGWWWRSKPIVVPDLPQSSWSLPAAPTQGEVDD